MMNGDRLEGRLSSESLKTALLKTCEVFLVRNEESSFDIFKGSSSEAYQTNCSN